MYRANKAISKTSNGLMLAPILVVIGFALIVIEISNSYLYNNGWYEVLTGSIFYVLMIVFGIASFINSNKKIKELKRVKFDILEDAFVYVFDGSEIIFSTENPLKSIKYNSGKIELSRLDNDVITINIGGFNIEYAELQNIKSKISKLNEIITIQAP